MRQATSPFSTLIVGELADVPRGTAQVVRGMLQWSTPSHRIRAISSTIGPRDWLSPVRTVRAAIGIVRLTARRSRGSAVAVAVQLTTRGSFVREGALVLLASACDLPVAAHLHGADFDEFSQRRRGLVGLVLRRADAVAVLTAGAEEICRSLVRSTTEVIRIPNGVVIPDIELANKVDAILFGGELSSRKGIDTLLAAWSQVSPDRGSWTLHLAGPDTDQVEGSLAALDGVVYHGVLSHDELLGIAQTTRIAVLPSRAEALPMFLIEAMAAQNAVISTSVGQIAELVSDDCGILIEAGDTSALAAALSGLIRDGDRVDALGRHAQERVSGHYSDTAVRDAVVPLWRRIAGRPRRGSARQRRNLTTTS